MGSNGAGNGTVSAFHSYAQSSCEVANGTVVSTNSTTDDAAGSLAGGVYSLGSMVHSESRSDLSNLDDNDQSGLSHRNVGY